MKVSLKQFNTMQRYLAANFIPPFVVSLVFFLLFLLTSQLFRLVGIVVNKGAGFGVVAGLFGHIAISFLPMAVPLSTLFATIYCLNKMSEDSEIVAMRSFGMTKEKLFRPFLIVGVFIALSIFALNRNLIPHSKTLFKNTIIKLTSKGMLTNIKAGNFFTDIPKVIIFAEEVSDNGNQLGDVFIRYEQADGERVIMAESGRLIKQYFSETQTPTLRMKLKNGNIVTQKDSADDIDKIIFKEYDFPVLEGGQSPGFVTKDSMRSNYKLSQFIKSKQKEIQNLESKENKSNEDNNKINDLKKRLPKSQIEYWSRFNTPFLCLAFIFLGFGLGIKKGRGRGSNTTVTGLLILIGYYAVFFTGVSVARSGYLPAWFIVFFPTSVVGFLAIKYYRRVDWAG